jgi:hypothetical protein
VVRNARWDDGGEIGTSGKLEGGGEEFDIGRIDLAEGAGTESDDLNAR